MEHGWREVNQGTRNLVQESVSRPFCLPVSLSPCLPASFSPQLSCCGWRSLDEFRNNEPIDESCYERVSAPTLLALAEEGGEEAPRRMKQEPCMNNLQDWFLANKITWVTLLATVAAVQVRTSTDLLVNGPCSISLVAAIPSLVMQNKDEPSLPR